MILVPLDGSARAENALAYALSLAESTGSRVLLFRAPDPELQDSLMPAIVEQDGRWQEADAFNLATSYLDRLIQKYAYRNVALEAQVQEGDPADLIVDLAEAGHADLIVMAPRGVSGLSRWVFGTVTERVLRRAPCPVLVTRETEPSPAITITVDGSLLAERALPVGFALAKSLSWSVTLLRVEPPLEAEDAAMSPAIWHDEEDAQARYIAGTPHAAAAAYLNRLARQREMGDVVVRRIMLFGSPAERILEFADSMAGGLLVMATHGRSGLQRLVYGSVTEQVMHGTERSLLIVRAMPDSGHAEE